ncbi:hypothetical protein GCM10023183_21870 [Nibribacter koreensis]|uniref:MFS transporter n=1 Tax=Nibribacter koreensis TaxID=1084519 RepID=A0ABP8FLC4_9BACT
MIGGGHGYYSPAIILFPTGMISFSFFGELRPAFTILAICQFPIYGLLIDMITNKQKTLCLIASFHIGLVLLIFLTVKDL